MKRIMIIPLLCLPHLALAEDAGLWSYEGDTGPAEWGDLSAEYATCKIGLMQSPIELGPGGAAAALEYERDYRSVPLNVWNNGRTVVLTARGGGEMHTAGTDFALMQVHFHTPSEHTLNGDSFPAEIHFVHQAAVGQLAVLGVLLTEGEAHPELDKLLPHMTAEPDEPVNVDGVSFDPAALLPRDAAVYRYTGSLTTPPCSENVAWHVLSEPVTASAEQIAALIEVMGENNRPLQPANNRLIVNPPTGG